MKNECYAKEDWGGAAWGRGPRGEPLSLLEAALGVSVSGTCGAPDQTGSARGFHLGLSCSHSADLARDLVAPHPASSASSSLKLRLCGVRGGSGLLLGQFLDLPKDHFLRGVLEPAQQPEAETPKATRLLILACIPF